MKNNADTKPVPAGEATGGKLSEVIDALENGSLKPDCKALLLVADKERSRVLFDHNLIDVSDIRDLQLLQLRLGLNFLASQFLRFDPEAMAAAYGRDFRQEAYMGRVSRILELGGEDGDDGKEAAA